MFYLIFILGSITAMHGMDSSIVGIVSGSSSRALEEAESALSDGMDDIIIPSEAHRCINTYDDALASTMSSSTINELISDIEPAILSALASRSGNEGIDFLSTVDKMMRVRFDPGLRVMHLLMAAKIYYIEGNSRTLTISFNYNLMTKNVELDQAGLEVFLKVEQH